MAFPVNGVLDNFDRANAGPPPSASWTGPMDPADTFGLFVVTNQCKANGGGWGGAYWNGATFGTNTEVYCTVRSNHEFFLYARIASPGGAGAMDGYAVDFAFAGDVIKVYRIDNAVYTQLGTTISQTLAVGDQIGFSVIGSTITVYVNGTSVGTRSDSTYSAAGYIGADVEPSGILDDFGGGTLVTTSPLGTVTQTNAALALGKAKKKAINLVTETDLAMALGTRIKKKALGMVLETDLARPIGHGTITAPVGTVTQTNTALPIGKKKKKTLGIALQPSVALQILTPVTPVTVFLEAAFGNEPEGAASITGNAVPTGAT